ncbi:MAG: hypothetical protein C4K58_06405 [Flavobacteriaceae bacterium]|nr:MAG: hypothetical protein C4K58_06405 [Flavobacteriaceae bacterium]
MVGRGRIKNISMKANLFFLCLVTFFSCSDKPKDIKKENAISTAKESKKPLLYSKEPNDSADYKHLKYQFYKSKSGKLCERKIALARNQEKCNCEFIVIYDSNYIDYNFNPEKSIDLNDVVEINTYVEFDKSEYSKDNKNVYCFQGNSDGGSRQIVEGADSKTFELLHDYAWGRDKNNVYYRGSKLEGLNIKYLKLFKPIEDSNDYPFLKYVKDSSHVFYEDNLVEGADAKSFKLVLGREWDSEDKNYKYLDGARYNR